MLLWQRENKIYVFSWGEKTVRPNVVYWGGMCVQIVIFWNFNNEDDSVRFFWIISEYLPERFAQLKVGFKTLQLTNKYAFFRDCK